MSVLLAEILVHQDHLAAWPVCMALTAVEDLPATQHIVIPDDYEAELCHHEEGGWRGVGCGHRVWCVCMRACMCVCAHVCAYAYVHVCVCMYVHVCVCVHVCV